MELQRDPFLQNAIVRGGLHGRASGNVAGVVYGAARTRTGKVVTARELVFPSNPQTAAQVLQRNIFKETLDATRKLGSSLWQGDFNRAIGQLPGFHSMMSIILNMTNASEEVVAGATTPLGNLHWPGTLTVATGAGAGGSVTVTYTAEVGINGTVNDVVKSFAIRKDATAGQIRYAKDMAITGLRSALSFEPQTSLAGDDFVIGVYIQGAGSAVGNLSQCRYFDVTSHA